MRSLTLGDQAQAALRALAGYYIVRALLWMGLFVVLFAPLAARKYQKG